MALLLLVLLATVLLLWWVINHIPKEDEEERAMTWTVKPRLSQRQTREGGNQMTSVAYIEPANVTVRPDFDVNGVELEIADQEGIGFKTLFDREDALDIAVRIIGAVEKLRGDVSAS
jgi:hypothetical protein